MAHLIPSNHSVEHLLTEQLQEAEGLLAKEGSRILAFKFFRIVPPVMCDEILMVAATNLIHNNASRYLTREAMSSKFYFKDMFASR